MSRGVVTAVLAWKYGVRVEGCQVYVKVEVNTNNVEKNNDKVQQLQSVHLSKTIDLRKLIGTSGATFKVNTSNEKFEDDLPCYDKEALLVVT